MKRFHVHVAVHDLAQSDKHWTIDPQGIAWGSFHTLEAASRYGDDTAPRAQQAKADCCAPAAA
jgi:hypothetical protein